MKKKRRQNYLPGGDALTWALLLGVGGFAAFKAVEEFKEREDAKKAGKTTAATAQPCGCQK